MTSITDGRGNVALTNAYTAGRLTSQQYGTGAEASTVSFAYTGLTFEPGETHGARVTDGANHVTEHYFNASNQLTRLCQVGAATQTTRFFWETHDLRGETVSDDVPTQITLPDNRIVAYTYLGAAGADAQYKRRLNLVRVERRPNDASPGRMVTVYSHDDSLPVWDTRFGESFYTVIEADDENGVALQRTRFSYSSGGGTTLAGIDYDGLPVYAGAHHHEEFQHNQYGLITEHMYPENPIAGNAHYRRRDTFSYNDSGYLENQVVDADGLALKTSFNPDLVGRVEGITPPEGHANGITPIEARKTIYTWTDADLVDSIDYPETSFSLDRRPRTGYTYDPNGNITRVNRELFDKDGVDLSFGDHDIDTDDGGDAWVATRFDYDSRNRLIKVRRETDTVKNVTEYGYDGNDNVVLLKSPTVDSGEDVGNIVEYEYDHRNLPVLVKRSKQSVTFTEYDACGRAILRTEGYDTPESRAWACKYDGLGRLEYTTDPAGLKTRRIWDAAGRPTSVQSLYPDESIVARADYDYDFVGRPTRVKEMHRNSDGSVIGDGWVDKKTEYSDAGLVLQSLLEGTGTQYAYDTAQRLISATTPTGSIHAREYDRNGNLKKTTETVEDTASHSVASYVTEFDYDYLDRCVEERILGNTPPNTTSYAYDSLGRCQRVTDGRGIYRQTFYDPLDRPVINTYPYGAISNQVVSAYDANGRLLSRMAIDGKTTHYAYDSLDRLVQTTYQDGSTDRFTQYDAVGNLVESISATGLISRMQYDTLGRMVEQRFEQLGGRTNPGPVAFAYDALGRVVSAVNDVASISRRHDALARTVAVWLCASAASRWNRNETQRRVVHFMVPFFSCLSCRSWR